MKRLVLSKQKISTLRDEKCNPLYVHNLFKSLEKQNEMHCLGEIPDKEFRPSNIFNMDEMHVDTALDPGKIMTYRSYLKERVLRARTGEKSPFHVTLAVTSRSDGVSDIPWMVIHDNPCGDGGNMMTMKNALNLALDLQSTAAQSGYMTPGTFRGWCQHFIKHSKSSMQNRVLLYLDGHYSHWDAEGLKYLMGNCCVVIFLFPRTLWLTNQMITTSIST